MNLRQRHTWRDAEEAVAGLTQAGRDLMGLLARLPLASAEILTRLRGAAGPAAIYRHLDQLRAAGLVDAVHAPVSPRLSHRLWYPSDLGLATLSIDQGADHTALARAHRLRRSDLLARLRRLPSLLALYRLLGALAVAGPGTPHMLEWEAPWQYAYRRIDTVGRAAVLLPARVAVSWDTATGTSAAEFLLLPDLATAPLAAQREALARLLLCRQDLERTGHHLPDLLVATPASRATAWAALLEELRAARRDAPLPARIATWENLDTEVREAVDGGAGGRRSERLAQFAVPLPSQGEPPDTPIPRIVGRGPQGAPLPALRLRPGEWALLDLLARHLPLPRDLAAQALGWTDKTLRRRRHHLIDLGLARLVPIDELCGRRVPTPELHRIAAREPAEATADGLVALAAWQGLSLRAAVRWNGLAGGGPETPVGTRAGLLAAPLHTLGIEEFFAHLARHGRRAAQGGAEEGLMEWRNAAACARGRFRPDGYVVYRRGDQHHAAFVEYDRGTMGERDWEQKLAAYFDYRDSGRARRDYAGFPTLLVVVAAKPASEIAIEGRIADLLRRLVVGRAPLPALLTTATRLAAAAAGALGPVWREAAADHRRHWFRAGARVQSPGRTPGRSGSANGKASMSQAVARPPPGQNPPDIGDRTQIREQTRRFFMINHYMSILADELRAEGVADPLAQPFTLAALWDDLAALASEAPPALLRGYLADDTGEHDSPQPEDEGMAVGEVSRDAEEVARLGG